MEYNKIKPIICITKYDLLNKINSLGPFGHGYDMPLIGVKNNDFNINCINIFRMIINKIVV